MSLIQFLRIMIARRWLVLGTTLVCLLTAIVVGLFLPKVYEGKARVVLDLVKPDPVTGQMLNSSFARAYTQTQFELIRDQGTMGAVIDQLGWARNPAVAQAMSGSATPEEARAIMADQLIGKTQVRMIAASNVMEIVYRGQSPEQARALAGLVRSVYLDNSLRLRKEEAQRNANWYQQQLDRAQQSLSLAEAAKTKFQRENGIVLEQDQQQLAALTSGATSAQAQAATQAPSAVVPEMASSGLRLQLAELDQRLVTASTQLGPNHPGLQAMQRQRAALAAQIQSIERATIAAANATASAAASGASRMRQEMEAQKSRYLQFGEKYDQLATMQRDIDQRKLQYQNLAERLSQLRLEANTTEAGMSILGDPVADDAPTGLRMPVLWVVAAGFGFVLGLLFAVLVEMLARRVRGIEDLEYLAPAPVLAMLSERDPRGGWLRKLLKPREADGLPSMAEPAGVRA